MLTIEKIRTLLDIADRLEYESLALDADHPRAQALAGIVTRLRREIDAALAELDGKSAA